VYFWFNYVKYIKVLSTNNFIQKISHVSALFNKYHEEVKGRPGAAYYVRHTINGLAVAAQVTGFLVWPIVNYEDLSHPVLHPIALLFISCGWWENYIAASKRPGKQDIITTQLHYSLPPYTLPSSTPDTYQRA
jgi:hypothetical protein